MFPVSSGFPLQDPMANLEFQRFSFNLRLIYIKTLCIWHLKHNLSNALGLHYNFNDGARKKKNIKRKNEERKCQITKHAHQAVSGASRILVWNIHRKLS